MVSILLFFSYFLRNGLVKGATLLIAVPSGCGCLSVDCGDSNVEKVSEDKNGQGISYARIEWKGE